MANVKISQLPALTSITGTDVLPIVSGNTTYNVTAANIAAYTTGNVTFSDITVQGVNGLKLSAGPDFTANSAYLQVRAGDQASHIHLDTGDNSTYDLLVGNDQKYVQVGLGGNISISSYGNTGQYIWNFDTPGNLSLPTNGNIDFNGGGIVQTPNQDFTVTVQDPTNDDSYAVVSQVVNGNSTPYTETRLQSGGFSVATNIDTSTYTWNFDSVGILTTPGNIQGSAGNSTSFYAIDDGSAGSVELKTISFAGATLGSNVTVRQSNVTISTNNNGNTWTFDNAGVLTLPGEGVVRSNNDTLILQSYNTGTSTGNGIRIGTSGGLFFENGSNPTYLNILESANNAVLTATANLQIVTDGTNTTPTWNFDTSGNLTLPGNTFQVNYANGTPVSLGSGGGGGNSIVNGTSNVSIPVSDDNVVVSAGGATWQFTTDQRLVDPQGGGLAYYGGGGWTSLRSPRGQPISVVSYRSDSTPATAYTANGQGNVVLESLDAFGNPVGTWTFDNTGNLSAGGNISVTGNVATAGILTDGYYYANGTPVTFGGGSSYGDSNVVSLLSAYGSNTVSTTGNVTSGNFLTGGIVSATGNVRGANLNTAGDLSVTGNATVSGTGSNVTRRAFGLVAADVNVTLDDLSANVSSSTSQLGLSTSGSWQGTGYTETFTSGTPSVQQWVNLPLSSGFSTASGAMNSQGQGCRCIITDQTPSAKMYEINVIRSGTSGALWNISIERLV